MDELLVNKRNLAFAFGPLLAAPRPKKLDPKMRYNQGSIEEHDTAVERLRDFLRVNYMTGSEAAQRIGIRAERLYSWLQAKSTPRSAKRIISFLDSMPLDRGGITPTGY